jgi:hypothetical protein
MAYMIQMVMSDQNGRKGICGKTMLMKDLLQTPQTDTCINKDSPFISPEIVAVSATAA